eukprot:tig00000076_g2325.t1
MRPHALAAAASAGAHAHAARHGALRAAAALASLRRSASADPAASSRALLEVEALGPALVALREPDALRGLAAALSAASAASSASSSSSSTPSAEALEAVLRGMAMQADARHEDAAGAFLERWRPSRSGARTTSGAGRPYAPPCSGIRALSRFDYGDLPGALSYLSGPAGGPGAPARPAAPAPRAERLLLRSLAAPAGPERARLLEEARGVLRAALAAAAADCPREAPPLLVQLHCAAAASAASAAAQGPAAGSAGHSSAPSASVPGGSSPVEELLAGGPLRADALAAARAARKAGNARLAARLLAGPAAGSLAAAYESALGARGADPLDAARRLARALRPYATGRPRWTRRRAAWPPTTAEAYAWQQLEAGTRLAPEWPGAWHRLAAWADRCAAGALEGSAPALAPDEESRLAALLAEAGPSTRRRPPPSSPWASWASRRGTRRRSGGPSVGPGAPRRRPRRPPLRPARPPRRPAPRRRRRPRPLPLAPGGGAPSAPPRRTAAALRLLRALAAYAPLDAGTREALAAALPAVPAAAWLPVLPQLFSAAGHRDPFVRDQVRALLRSVAGAAPGAALFPALVAARPPAPSSDPSEDSAADSTALAASAAASEVPPRPAPPRPASRTIVEDVKPKTKSPEERRRYIRPPRLLPAPPAFPLRAPPAPARPPLSERRQANTALSEADKRRLLAAKYEAVMRPALAPLERAVAATFGARGAGAPPGALPESAHERAFRSNGHGAAVLRAAECLRRPADPGDAAAAYAPLREATAALSRAVKAAQGSPLRLQWAPEAAPEAAAGPDAGAAPTLLSFQDEKFIRVAVLPSKTRPKRLAARGSDGRPYAYLAKGLEDLRLDARVMQFHRHANRLAVADRRGRVRRLRVRHYAVVPLGETGGLIQVRRMWVDHAVPLYALYRHWQQRQAAARGEAGPPPRPTDLFYSKLMPALQEAGIVPAGGAAPPPPRSKWPPEVLRRVYGELVAGTPRDLLSKELWCSSPTPGEWWERQQSFARSAAAASVVGYVLGIGDRHLDNVLLDASTAEVVHIDHSVCFEKGARLRVPELVPFRLTHTMAHAMGVGGVEGAFRGACEVALSALRAGREGAEALVEAFVGEPFVAEALRRAPAPRRRALEASVAAALLASRIDELRPPLLVRPPARHAAPFFSLTRFLAPPHLLAQGAQAGLSNALPALRAIAGDFALAARDLATVRHAAALAQLL